MNDKVSGYRYDDVLGGDLVFNYDVLEPPGWHAVPA